MVVKQRIYLFGNSVILAALKVSLRSCPEYDITTLTPPLPEPQGPAALKPDVVLFDLEITRPEAVFSMMEFYPGLVLIGVSPDKNMVKIWSGQQIQELSTQGLLETIRGRLQDLPQ